MLSVPIKLFIQRFHAWVSGFVFVVNYMNLSLCSLNTVPNLLMQYFSPLDEFSDFDDSILTGPSLLCFYFLSLSTKKYILIQKLGRETVDLCICRLSADPQVRREIASPIQVNR